ncbi:MAG: hypothetical protein ACYTFI_12295 [Planctomycetota bacterium]|jgi:hypothetical protein
MPPEGPDCPADGRPSRWTVVVVTLVALLAVIIVAAVASHDRRREQRRRELCLSYLKNLSCVCYFYAKYNGGVYPSDLGRLYPDDADDGRVFICPSANRAVEFTDADLPPDAKDASGVFGPEHTDYAYVAGLNYYRAKPGWVLMFDKASHPGGVRNVALLGAGVCSMSEEELKRQLETTLREARAAGFDAKVWGYAPGEGPLEPTP